MARRTLASLDPLHCLLLTLSVQVVPTKGAYVVNLGDMFMRWYISRSLLFPRLLTFETQVERQIYFQYTPRHQQIREGEVLDPILLQRKSGLRCRLLAQLPQAGRAAQIPPYHCRRGGGRKLQEELWSSRSFQEDRFDYNLGYASACGSMRQCVTMLSRKSENVPLILCTSETLNMHVEMPLRIV